MTRVSPHEVKVVTSAAAIVRVLLYLNCSFLKVSIEWSKQPDIMLTV
jgi:hypothetical protein